jgi:rRNA metabolism SBDS family protein
MVQIVKYSKGKKRFEVLTNDGMVRKYRDKKVEWDKVLVTDQIFLNSKKGDVAKSKDLKDVFGKDDWLECLKYIVDCGELQVSASERKEDLEKHKRSIIEYIHSSYVDGNGLPHPVTRLVGVLVDSKVRIDSSINVRKQVEEIIKKMIGILVFKKNTVDYLIKISTKYSKKAESVMSKFSSVLKQNKDGELSTWRVSITPKSFDEFLNCLNKVTYGDYTLEEVASTYMTIKTEVEHGKNGRKGKKTGRIRT